MRYFSEKINLRSHVPTDGSVEISASLVIGGDKLNFTFSQKNKFLREDVTARLGVLRDKIYDSTCAEFFIGTNQSEKYIEYNFAPNGDWYAFAFSEYRREDSYSQILRKSPPRSLTSQIQKYDSWQLQVEIPVEQLAGFLELENGDANTKLRINICGIVLAVPHTFYFAYAHPHRPDPDFHDRSAWLELQKTGG